MSRWRIVITDSTKKAGLFTFSAFFLSVLLAVQLTSSSYASSDAYDSGYDHGCDDAGIPDPDDRYINQPGKGPSFHTDRFMDGYNEGFDAYSGGNDGGEESERGSGNSDSNTGGSDYGLTVCVCLIGHSAAPLLG
jgi:hypothetical protein